MMHLAPLVLTENKTGEGGIAGMMEYESADVSEAEL